MKILVTAKRIPDPTQKLKLKDNALDLSGANWQLNQFDEYAVEAALRLTEDGANQAVRQGQVTVASLGPADVATQLRSALAMGADKAIRVDAKDDDLDASIVAKTIVKLVQRDQPDLVLMGKLAADNEGNDVGQRVAGILGWPQATFACSIQVVDGGKAVVVGREVDAGVELKKVQLPAVVTVDLRIVSPHAVKNARTKPEFAYADGPRYSSLKGIRAANSKPFEQLTLAQLGVSATPKTKVLKVETPPARQAGKKVGSVAELVEKLQKEAKVI